MVELGCGLMLTLSAHQGLLKLFKGISLPVNVFDPKARKLNI